MATLTIVSILINVIFLDNLKRSESEEQQSEESSTKNPIKKFFKQLTHPYQILITPFSLWIGFIQGFMIADFTGVTYNHTYRHHLNHILTDVYYSISLRVCLVFTTSDSTSCSMESH